MTTGTLDWSNPLPGGARQVLNDHPNLGNVGGIYNSPWFDVTVFSGLLFEWQNFGLAGDFGDFNVNFRDAANTSFIKPTYHGTWRGDMQGAVNIPVLGSQASLVVTGPAHNVTADVTITGHGGGPGTQVGLASQLLVNYAPAGLAAGATVSQVATLITEGAAILTFACAASKGQAYVLAANGAGVQSLIGGFQLPANMRDVRRIWLPPSPVFVNVNNDDAAAGDFSVQLMKERS